MHIFPVFTKRFNELPPAVTSQPTPSAQTQQPIRFPQCDGQSIGDFIRGDDFARCQQEYAQLIDRITQFVDDHAAQLSPTWRDDTVKNINDNFALLKHHLSDLHLDYFGPHKSDVYGAAKEMFHKLEELLHQEELPLAKRMEAIQELAPQVGVCAGGIVTALQKAIFKLTAAGIQGAAQQTKIQIIEAFILDHVRHTHGDDPNNEVHIVNAYFNRLADEMGLPTRQDPFISIGESRITSAQFEACRQSARAKLTPNALATAMANNYLDKIRGAFAADRINISQPIAAERLGGVSQRIEDLQLGGLDHEYGKVPMECYLLTQPDSRIKLTQKPALLARHFLGQLRENELVDHNNAIQLNPDGDQVGKIMQLGDLFWVNKDGSCEELDAQALAGLSPQAIGQTLEQGSVPRSAYAEVFEHIARQVMEPYAAAHEEDDVDAVDDMPGGWFDQIASVFDNQLQNHPALGASVVMLAAVQGNDEALQALIEARANIHGTNDEGQTAAMLAARYGHDEALQVLIDNHANLNAQDLHGMTAMIHAAENGHDEVVGKLWQSGANINAEDHRGMTAVMHAAIHGHKYALDMLVDNGADVNDRDNDGKTAMMIAAASGHLKAVQDLRSYTSKEESNAKDDYGMTAAMHAGLNGHADVLLELRKAGADINARNNEGMTAVMIAAAHGLAAALDVLYGAHADFNARDPQGRTAAMIAEANGHAALRAAIETAATAQANRSAGQSQGNRN